LQKGVKKSHDLIPALVSLLCNRQLEIGQPLPIIKKLMPVVGDTYYYYYYYNYYYY